MPERPLVSTTGFKNTPLPAPKTTPESKPRAPTI